MQRSRKLRYFTKGDLVKYQIKSLRPYTKNGKTWNPRLWDEEDLRLRLEAVKNGWVNDPGETLSRVVHKGLVLIIF